MHQNRLEAGLCPNPLGELTALPGLPRNGAPGKKEDGRERKVMREKRKADVAYIVHSQFLRCGLALAAPSLTSTQLPHLVNLPRGVWSGLDTAHHPVCVCVIASVSPPD